MEFLRNNGPLILLGLAVAILIAFAAYSFMRDDEEEDDDDDDDLEHGSTMKMSGSHASDTMELPETDDLRARKSRMIALKDSLERSLQTRAGVKAVGGIDRLAMPWFMLVGSAGSGKRSLLASTGLPLPYGPPVEVDSSKKDAGRWWLFEDAVVVEAPTVKPAAKAPEPSDATAATAALAVDTSEGWNNLLHLLRRERPDSPLNGIVVTVSCADLMGSRRKSPEELNEQAELIKAFLERTRRVLGMRFPVHVLVTRCDIIPGFRSFTETLPESRRDDIFGWSNPRPLEKVFEPAWVESGFTEVHRSLELLHDEMLAAPETVHDADGLFVFVNEFGDLQDPLVDFVARLMPAGERRPSLFLRGVYFTGDPSERAARAAESDDNATLHISIEAAEAESNSLVFLRSLFAGKIFREAGLARTMSPVTISRDFRVLGAQAAALLIALLGGAGLWASLYGFNRGGETYGAAITSEASELTRLMSGVAIDLDQIRRRGSSGDTAIERRVQDAAVLSLVTEMRRVSSTSIRSPFVPSSWLSGLPDDVREAVIAGLQNTVLPIARQRLQDRVEDLLGANGNAPAIDDDLDATDPKSLSSYLFQVRDLNRNIARYNALASSDSGSAAELAGLVDYLFGERLTLDSVSVSSEFEKALRVAEASRLSVTAAQTSAVVARAVAIVTAITDTATLQLTGRGSAQPGEDLLALRRLRDLADLTDAKTGLVATIRDSSPNGARVARTVQDSIGARLAIAATRVLRDSLLPEQAGTRLRSVLTGLFAMRLLDPVEGREIVDELRAGQTMRWDIGQLELAFALRGEMRRAQIAVSDAFPAATQSRLRRDLDSQMAGRLVDIVAGAQRFIADTIGAVTTIRSVTENIDAASDRLIRLNRLLDTLRMPGEGRKLVVMGTRQSEQVLALAQGVLDSADYLAPHPIVVSSWRGGFPIGFAAMGVTDTGSFKLRLDREQIPPVQALAVAVEPALAFLRQPAVSASMISNPMLVSEWRGIVAAIGSAPTSQSLASLYEYIVNTMGPIDQPGCQAVALRADAGRPSGSDWFTQRRSQFRAALLGRCHPGGSGDALAAYQRLREVFTTRLAGRYPFVDSARAAAAPDADPSAVREFYGLMDGFTRAQDVMLRSDPRLGPGARPAFVFLDQAKQARSFFAPMIDSGMTRRVPELAFVVEPLADGTTAELHVSDRVALLGDSARTGMWTFGEPVRLLASGDSAAADASLAGSWGIVKLGARRGPVSVRFYHPDTKVRLRVPAFPSVAPEIPVARR